MTQSRFIEASWNPVTITLMIVGFLIFWPLGFMVIGYICWGDKIRCSLREMSSDFSAHAGAAKTQSRNRSTAESGNFAFDEYRELELSRLEEERLKLDKMRDEFDAYLSELRQAKDKAEFDRFMKDHKRPGSEAS